MTVYSRFRSGLVGATVIALSAPCTAEPIHPYWPGDLGLIDDDAAAATVRLTIPFGTGRTSERSAEVPRLSFGMDFGRYDADVDRRLALGFTLDGEFLLEANHITLSRSELMAAMNADESEAGEGGGSAAPWVIGGVVAVGLLVVAANETADELSDATRCIVDAVFGEDCEQ